ncbi:hypothetical protein IH980_03050 [Patescibacteria group bacterium]|nr:hypothetical protein [Patescibacteria group bacterium]
MNLPNILSKFTTKEKTQEQFLAIEIGTETVTTAVWQVVDGQTQIVKLGATEEWKTEKDSIDSLLTAIDASLEKALADAEPEPNKVIFGLQESWVAGETITKDYAKILKRISEKLEFEPIGFVVTSEAIVHLLKQQEGTPPTAILILVTESEIQVTLVNVGKILGSQTVSRSEDIGADVEEGLARFEIEENMPSRMLLFNGTLDLESLKQNLLSCDWLEKLPFLHFPKVEVLEKQVTIKAVAIGGGAEAAKALGFEIIEEEEKEKEEKEEAPPEVEGKEALPEETIPTAEEIGFKTDVDVAQEVAKKEEPKEEKPKEEEAKPRTPPSPEEQAKEEVSVETPEGKEAWSAKLISLTSMIPRMMRLPRLRIPRPSDLLDSRLKMTIGIVIAFFVLSAAAVMYGYWTIPRAQIVLYVRPKTLETELIITIDPKSNQVVAAENRIPGKIVGMELEGEKEKETTGSKLVGEKAKGEVSVYNKTSAAKTFAAGTMLVGPNKLAFSLDSEVSVASASSQESDEAVTTTFGKAKASITATAIGTEYNLPADTDFTLKAFSTASYDAKNESNISGGTSREIQAIAKNDIDDLLNQLKQELKQKAANELESQEGPGRKVLVDGVEIEVLSSEVSGEVGEEAQTVSAKIKAKITTLAYDDEDYNQILRLASSEAIPQDFRLQEDESFAEVKEVEFQDGLARITVVYKAVLIPRIEEQEIKRKLTGKHPQLVEKYLGSLPNFSKAEVKITPEALPARLKTFPRKAENITIEIRIERDE